MKFTVVASLLSATTVLASPLEARQADRAIFNRQITSVQGNGCANITRIIPEFVSDTLVQITLLDQTARIGRPEDNIPEQDREKVCRIALQVVTPAGRKTVNAVATSIGEFSQPGNTGAEGFLWRHHVYGPASVTAEKRFTGTGPQPFIETDPVTVVTNLGTAQTVEYAFEGRVRLQRTSDPNAVASLRQSVYTLDIGRQS
ncbi:hypothetical protein QBC42DRAFT_286517 [Cladorrhinum samala]|uniref:Uncharacterized protein n=1 Tax=Cladorrhinum samala TaxID=585594 RepID=A0AAV9HNS6_9PEZI|nr:hypothetical protein QBC42DRAFT_286517 [Cladorrhinum samala]